MRYKADGKWIRTSTKEAKLEDAKQAAVKLVTNAWFRVDNNLPVVNKRFKHVANLAIKRMEELLANGLAKLPIVITFKQSTITLFPILHNTTLIRLTTL